MQKYLSNYAPSLGELWLIMLVFLCLGGSIIGSLVAIILSHILPVDTIALSLALYPLTFAVAIPFILIRAKRNYSQKVLHGVTIHTETSYSFGSLHGVLFFALLFLLIPAFNIVIEPFTVWMKMPEFLKELFGTMGNQGWISVLSLVVMAPLLEEWLCRRVALKGLIKNGYSPAAAIIWSALMFGVIHMNPWQAIPAFLIGLLFGWVYWRTNSLWSVIFLHAVNNGLSMIFVWTFPDLPEDVSTYEAVGPTWYYPVFALSLIVVVSIIYLFYKKLSISAPLFDKTTPPTS